MNNYISLLPSLCRWSDPSVELKRVTWNCCSSFTSEAADRLQIMLSKKTFLCLYLFLACYGIEQIVAWTAVPCSSIPNVKFIRRVHSFGFTFHFSLHHWSATIGKAAVDYQYFYWSMVNLKLWLVWTFIMDAKKTITRRKQLLCLLCMYVSFAKIVKAQHTGHPTSHEFVEGFVEYPCTTEHLTPRLVRNHQVAARLAPCSIPFKISKFYKISHHIESLTAYMKY
jgi:hypothetical protein